MLLTVREFWTAVHGVIFGAIFLLAFAGGLAELWGLRPQWATLEGIQARLRQLHWGTTIMAIMVWLAVLSGTYIVYPWYRAKPPEGADLSLYPRSYLLSNPVTASWHKFGMEWKEHVAWLAPILAVVVTYVVWKYGDQLAEDSRLRKALIVLFTLAFVTAGIGGLLGAFITKVAPLR
jgi:hypothetical protein